MWHGFLLIMIFGLQIVTTINPKSYFLAVICRMCEAAVNIVDAWLSQQTHKVCQANNMWCHIYPLQAFGIYGPIQRTISMTSKKHHLHKYNLFLWLGSWIFFHQVSNCSNCGLWELSLQVSELELRFQNEVGKKLM